MGKKGGGEIHQYLYYRNDVELGISVVWVQERRLASHRYNKRSFFPCITVLQRGSSAHWARSIHAICMEMRFIPMGRTGRKWVERISTTPIDFVRATPYVDDNCGTVRS